MTTTIKLFFRGYWLFENRKAIPNESGVYAVYTCQQKTDGVSLQKLVYVGESNDMRERVDSHERLATWQAHLAPGEELCFSAATVGTNQRARAEAAVVFETKPPENVEYRTSFPFTRTSILCTGSHKFIPTSFTVDGTP